MHSVGPERHELLARARRVRDERRDIDGLARRREWAKAQGALLEQHGRAVEVSLPPVVKADADLEDPVIEAAVRRAGVAPEELERLVLLEELALVELREALQELRRRRQVAARADGLVDLAARDTFRRARGLAVAATRRRASSR